eukprot:scaffold932_cov207-Alexandrium_tamarense.AAC.20
MLYRTTLLSLLAIGVTNAFMTAPSAITRTSPLNLMSAKEIDYIMSEAEQCAAGECALDEVESLITNLQSQQSLLSKRIGEIDTLVKDLEHINGRDNRPVDEVKETVRAIFRVFSLGSVIVSLSVSIFGHRDTRAETVEAMHKVSFLLRTSTSSQSR